MLFIMKKRNIVLQLIPFFVAAFFAVLAIVLYTFLIENRSALDYAEMSLGALIPLILPVLGWIAKKDFPVLLNAFICLQTVLAIDFGRALGFYGLLPWWDLFMHGIFGVMASVFAAYFLIRWKGEGMTGLGKAVFILMFTLGCAALWEVWEYLCSLIFGNDPQGVQSAIEQGISPIADTMEDIMIAVAGVAVFFGVVLVDKLKGGKLAGWFYRVSVGEEKTPPEPLTD